MQRRAVLTGLAASAALLSCKEGCKPTTRADVGGVLLDDVSRLNACRVRKVVVAKSGADVVAAVKEAKERGWPIIAAGRRHSQGGQCSVDDGIVIDMTSLRTIDEIDVEAQTVRVEAGASWDELQRALNPRGLAVRTMQSSNIFTVGGSLGSNIHGRDINDGVIFSSVLSLTLVDADGDLRVLNKGDPLLPFVVGGYGLFGVVVEATLQLTKNALLRHDARLVAGDDVFDDFAKNIAGQDALYIARPSIAPSSFLDETIVETWTRTDEAIDDAHLVLGEEQNVKRDKLVFDASRASPAGKEARWVLQREAALAAPPRVTRNNAMRPPTTPLSFLAHDDDGDTDIVQEYFVPAARAGEFLAKARKILLYEKTNLLGLTIRFVKGNADAVLSFAPSDSFAFMFYTNHKRTDPGLVLAQHMTTKLVDAVLDVGGKHYLTYQAWPSKAQTAAAYPQLASFFAKKQEIDPQLRFRNRFLDAYTEV